jgi:hypothetical protein
MPTSLSACFTSSSLCGLIIATTIFIVVPFPTLGLRGGPVFRPHGRERQGAGFAAHVRKTAKTSLWRNFVIDRTLSE